MRVMTIISMGRAHSFIQTQYLLIRESRGGVGGRQDLRCCWWPFSVCWVAVRKIARLTRMARAEMRTTLNSFFFCELGPKRPIEVAFLPLAEGRETWYPSSQLFYAYAYRDYSHGIVERVLFSQEGPSGNTPFPFLLRTKDKEAHRCP